MGRIQSGWRPINKIMNSNSRFNQDFLDAISILSFMIGVMNLDENLSQSDKDDMMHSLDVKTTNMLKQIEKDLDYQNQILFSQNQMLEEISKSLKRLEESNARH